MHFTGVMLHNHSAALLLATFFALGTGLAPDVAEAQAFVVNTTVDARDASPGDGTCDADPSESGKQCTLRAAVQEANALSSRDLIVFDRQIVPTLEPGGPAVAPATISIDGSLGPLTLRDGGVTIDGTRLNPYPSPTGGPVIFIDGSGISDQQTIPGLHLKKYRTAVKGIGVVRFPADGIKAAPQDEIGAGPVKQARITDCFVGVEFDGKTPAGNDWGGISIFGEEVAVDGNVISGNVGTGISVAGSENSITNNIIGLNAEGDAAVPNIGHGIKIVSTATDNDIGTVTGSFPTVTYNGNVISGNQEHGVFLRGDGNSVVANRIGVSKDGSRGIGNKTGILIAGPGTGDKAAEDNQIGRTLGSNQVAGNDRNGITLGVASKDEAASGTVISSNNIGLSADRNAPLPNGDKDAPTAGIFGGLLSGSRVEGNTVSGNAGPGILIFGDDRNVKVDILDNLIGTNQSFDQKLGNAGDGIRIEPNPSVNADQIQVTDNIIGNNGDEGIDIQGSHHEVANNFIGAAPDNTDIGNAGEGVSVNNGSARLEAVNLGGNLSNQYLPGDGRAVGSPTPRGTGNVIGHNSASGISVTGKATGLKIEQNYVGTTPGGDGIGNGASGIFINGDGDSSTGHTIGYGYSENGSLPWTPPLESPNPSNGGFGNVIAFNDGEGVALASGTQGVSVRGNSIFQNSGLLGDLGIDLGHDGRTANDNLDWDTGANNLQNFPVFTSVDYDAATDAVTIEYTISTYSWSADFGSKGLKVDFYAADSKSSGEGRTYLDTQYYPSETNARQNTIDLSRFATVDSNDTFLATATDASGNTSEFSSGGAAIARSKSAGGSRLIEGVADLEAEVRGGVVQLSWKSVSTGSSSFEVQRRASGVSGEGIWKEVGVVEAKAHRMKANSGASSEAIRYQYADEDLPYAADTLSYRLRGVGAEGSAQVSDPVRVARSGVDQLQLEKTYPNPARSQVTVQYAVPQQQSDGKAGEDVEIRVYDTLGREVRKAQASSEPGRHHLSVNVSSLSSGVYFLRLRAGSQTRTQKITITR
jgi:CSLREA domain-containing protein